jgi:hypothetical protein
MVRNCRLGIGISSAGVRFVGKNKNLSGVILFGSSEEGTLLAGSLCRDEDWL